MKPGKKMLAAILIVIAALIYVAAFGAGSGIKGVREMRYGIDIRGGVEAVFEPQGLDRSPSEKELDTARQVIETRMDNQNIVDREVTVDKDGGYIIVRFPWKSGETNFNPEEAIAELGEMAELTFRDPDGNVLIRGKDVQNAAPETANNNGIKSYQVALSFNAEGSKLFEDATGKLIGKRMSIYMDQDLISSPTVQTKISGGQAVITGMQDYDDAKNLAEKINAGSLPFSLKTTNFSTISPSLGNNALSIMIYAGMAAFLVICLFMLVFYKLPGAVACVTLVLQTVLQMLAVSIPQYTLTLPGIAGIILTIGMAVDTNIIISERISDELKKGISVKGAVLTGYKNAFSSVLDGNVTTAIVAVILMFLGSGTMLSFGYTLLIGMIVNLLVGVSVSKQLLLSLIKNNPWNDNKWFRIRKDKKIIPFYQKKYIFGIISGVIILSGIAGCFVFGVKLDTQFTGGAVLSYSVSDEAETGKIQAAIEKQTNRPVTVQIKEDNMTGLKRLSVTLAGNAGMSPEDQTKVTDAINSTSDKVDAKLSETYVVEPYIGAKALKNAVVAIILSLLFIVIYVWIRFSAISGLPAGVTALIALIHDVAVVFFVFVLFRIPLNDAFVAVVLTIIGYSINDTIVIYDRIRENRKKDSKMPVDELVNVSTSQTLGRSINTSCTTGICVLIILAASVYFQIGSILQFSLPMFFGILTGCYSSICVAGTLWAMWEKKKVKK
ncbi:protein translocase subunit SecF [Lacrimispora celerecrescens]|uniref:Multifunctional fusion protein n=1 Tax=[Clostridium] celerecrescens 18A TaxID=1286362 RepID=A0A2M8Z7L3_9FIRM|nr:protein translocase subunit SecF [Lacrimispora celerecrescens]PJJ29429.1 SecD/SecF fusion protein [[Clostridium] celerecrescens 18A]